MEDLIYFFSTSDIPVCQIPFVLQIIYFGKILIKIVQILLPIILILYMLFDFSKCIISGDDSECSKIVKHSFKRILYAVIVYAVPYVVSVFASVLSDFVPDYSMCITNATAENIKIFTVQYENEEKKEEEERRELWKQNLSNKFSVNSRPEYIVSSTTSDFYYSEENLKQCDNSPWSSYPIKCAQNRNDGTICSSGCGYVAYTMVVRNFGYTDVTPDQIVDVACNEYGHTNSAASWDLLRSSVLNDKFGLTTRIITKDQIVDSLKQGNALIVLIPGHYISLLGINEDGTLIVGDSAFKQFASNSVYNVDSLYNATANFREPYGWFGVVEYSKK